jgi:hypothetical protein
MIVTSLVLSAVLLSITAVVVSFVPSRRASAIDESAITDPAQLDAAMAIQRSNRIAELQRRTIKDNYWPYALLGFAVLAQMAALAVDRFAHPSITAVGILPVLSVVFTRQAARRRYALRELDAYVRKHSAVPGAE